MALVLNNVHGTKYKVMRLVKTLILVLLVLNSHAQNCPKYDAALKKGNEALQQKNYHAALKSFQDAQIAARDCGNTSSAPNDGIEKVFKEIEAQRDNAVKAQKMADEEKEKAIDARGEMYKAYKYADSVKKMAQQGKLEAINAKMDADRLRLTSLSINVAYESQQIKGDPQLAALLADKAYLLVTDNSTVQNNLDPQVFATLYHQLDSAMAANGLTLDTTKKNKLFVHDVQVYNALYQGLQNFGDVNYPGVINITSEVKVMDVSTDGALYVIQGDEKLTVYTGADHKVTATLQLSASILDKAFLGNNCRIAVTAYEDNSVQIWNTATGQGSPSLSGHTGLVRAAAFSTDGSIVLTGGRDSSVIIWKNNSQQQKIKFPSRVRALTLTGNNDKIIAGCEDGIVYQCGINDNKITVLRTNTTDRITVITRSTQGRHVIVGTSGGQVCVLDGGLKIAKSFSEKNSVDFINADDASGLLAIGTANHTVHIYDLNDLSHRPLEINDMKTIQGLALSKEGNVSVACANNMVRVYTVHASVLHTMLKNKITRSLTKDEWDYYIGKDVPYHE